MRIITQVTSANQYDEQFLYNISICFNTSDPINANTSILFLQEAFNNFQVTRTIFVRGKIFMERNVHGN